jgi:c-di-GMP-binding flagellar brake protein YcgR
VRFIVHKAQFMETDGTPGKQRRRHERIKVQVSIEIRTAEGAAPLRLSTYDISLCGCYVETMFPLDLGARVFITLWLNEQPVRTNAVVATKYPQLGNGFDFVDMSVEDLLKLSEFIKIMASEVQNS